jgi:hypothetical protein
VQLDERRPGELAGYRNAHPTCPPRSSRPWPGWVENVEQVARGAHSFETFPSLSSGFASSSESFTCSP